MKTTDIYIVSGAGVSMPFPSIGEAIDELIRRNDSLEKIHSKAGLKAHLLNRFKPRYAVEYGACSIRHALFDKEAGGEDGRQ